MHLFNVNLVPVVVRMLTVELCMLFLCHCSLNTCTTKCFIFHVLLVIVTYYYYYGYHTLVHIKL